MLIDVTGFLGSWGLENFPHDFDLVATNARQSLSIIQRESFSSLTPILPKKRFKPSKKAVRVFRSTSPFEPLKARYEHQSLRRWWMQIEATTTENIWTFITLKEENRFLYVFYWFCTHYVKCKVEHFYDSPNRSSNWNPKSFGRISSPIGLAWFAHMVLVF